MSRDSNGNYTLAAGNPVVANDLIEADWANNSLDDIATALTDSLSRSGKGGMSAPLKLDSGVAAAPGLNWVSETSSGWYRVSSGVFRYSIAGTPIIELTANGLEILPAGGKLVSPVVNSGLATDKASAATVNLTTATGNFVHITGTVTITAITLGAGMWRGVIFDGALTLTHHATNNNLPGAANITTVAGDRALYWSDGTTVYCMGYWRKGNPPVVTTTQGELYMSKAGGVVTRSTNTMLDIDDFGRTIKATATFTQTLDAAATLTSRWFIDFIIDSGATITFNPNGSETIDGATTLDIVGPAQGRIVCDGSNFRTLGFIQNASDTIKGIAQIATKANQEAASNSFVMVTSGQQQYHPSAAKVWFRLKGTGTIALDASYNMTSVTDNGVGDYTATFDTDFSSANYCAVMSAAPIWAVGGYGFVSIATDGTGAESAPAAGTLRFITLNSTPAVADSKYIMGAFFGDQ